MSPSYDVPQEVTAKPTLRDHCDKLLAIQQETIVILESVITVPAPEDVKDGPASAALENLEDKIMCALRRADRALELVGRIAARI